ncbi:THxN family PEP-CTERM protein [Roseovarius sp.]|uniref:THxN family PEP-CTERM protein n=1 Tax=Roseovarius sp. TaxID=1486281 RepID=UPI003565CD3B
MNAINNILSKGASSTKYMATAALAITAVTALPDGANAATLDFASLKAAWVSPSGGNVISNNTNPTPVEGTTTASINWGGDTLGVSGYDFTFDSDPVPSPAVDVDTPFTLGEFVHRNQTITSNTAIDTVNLQLSGDIRLDEGVSKAAMFNFLFSHTETPNNATPCEFEDSPPCGDGVTISMLNTTDTFNVDSVAYTLTLNGFIPEGGTEPDTFFFSAENANNSATLQGEFTSTVIPLPAAGWMLLAGIGGLAAMRRRKKV